MISVSEAYKTAIDANTRRIIPRVLVYFSATPTEFTGDDIISLHLLEEAKAETGNPLGAISSNELTITFDNSKRYFIPTNAESPYYRLLKPNVRIEAFLALEVSVETYEEVPLGVFFTSEWNGGTVTGHDVLYSTGGLKVPMVKTQEQTTIGKMFALLLDAIDVADYSIDPGLTQEVRIGWLPKGTIKQALQTLSEAGNCTVNVDRTGKIKVSKANPEANPVVILTDDDQIIDAKNPQKYLEIYNVIGVNYCRPRLGDRQTILSIEEIGIESGEGDLDEAEFSNAPIGKVQRVSIRDSEDSEIDTVRYDAWSIVINASNLGNREYVDIEAKGIPIDTTFRYREASDDALIDEWGPKPLEIKNHLIQTPDIARTYASELLAMMSDPFKDFILDVRGNPALEIGDSITILSTANSIPQTDIIIERITLDFDGGLSGTIEGRKAVTI